MTLPRMSGRRLRLRPKSTCPDQGIADPIQVVPELAERITEIRHESGQRGVLNRQA